ncbi:MAG: glutamine synthetase III [Chloroherpetonaceae bacterium]|nr:glutamine synthetase III [Chloroherpetonaceae bacterium]
MSTSTQNGTVTLSENAAMFGSLTFNDRVMRERLPADVYSSLTNTLQRGEDLDERIAETVAQAMKEWAIENGATHYCHWFQPMTGATAEKHDAFIAFNKEGNLIEKFSGSQLIQGEPDASSFPSGGMRTTFEARGYTAWDPSSPAFLMKGPEGTTLCIPSVFISYHGEALDEKTPLLRSARALSDAAVKLLHLLGNKKVTRVKTYVGAEQEYFLIDRALYEQRPDLIMTGRTLIGALPPKNQQLEDHYFGSIPDRVMEFMQELEKELYQLGVPAKTRHNEVAPHQFEIAPIHEETPLASDHNLLTMEMLRRVAERKGLALLIHEKPFAGINGSGKHNNWSIAADVGGNLLDPGETPELNLQFLVFLVAVLKGIHKRAAVLRAAVANPGNDHRLGANEAPPAIISVFLGDQLSEILNAIEKGDMKKTTEKQFIDLDISHIPTLNKDNTDRNRTSPFAFTGNKFEFRAVPSSMPIAIPNMVLNTLMAEAIDEMREAIEAEMKAGKELEAAVFEVLRREIKATKPIRFEGDGYSEAWQKEAKKRGLPNHRNLPEAMKVWKDQSVREMFVKYGVLTEAEIDARYNVRMERYIKAIDIEAKTLLMMIRTQILPACMRFQSEVAESVGKLLQLGKAAKINDATKKKQLALVSDLAKNIAELMSRTDKLEELTAEIHHQKGLEA